MSLKLKSVLAVSGIALLCAIAWAASPILGGNGVQLTRTSSTPFTGTNNGVFLNATGQLCVDNGTSVSVVATTTAPGVAKGDIEVFDGSAWVIRSVGADGRVLTADSSQPDGVRWAAVSGGSGTVTSVTCGTGMTGGTITTTGTCSIDSTVMTLTGVQTGTNKTFTAPTISSPVLSGSASGTYTLAGTPTITSPAISNPILSGTATGTYTVGGTPTYSLSTPLAIGSTQTPYMTLENSTAASSGVQQYSPGLVLGGRGFKTNATAGSQTVKWMTQVRPVQGTANPTSDYVFLESINGGAYVEKMKFATLSGELDIIANTSDSYFANSTGTGIFNRSGTLRLSVDGNPAVDITPTSVLPSSGGTTLGDESHPWSNMVSTDAHIDGGALYVRTIGSYVKTTTGAVTTSDATATTLVLGDAIASGTAEGCWLSAQVVGMSSGNVVSYHMRSAVEKASGSGAIVGTVDKLVLEHAGLTSADATIDVSLGVPRVRVTGIAATSFTWTGRLETQCVNTGGGGE